MWETELSRGNEHDHDKGVRIWQTSMICLKHLEVP